MKVLIFFLFTFSLLAEQMTTAELNESIESKSVDKEVSVKFNDHDVKLKVKIHTPEKLTKLPDFRKIKANEVSEEKTLHGCLFSYHTTNLEHNYKILNKHSQKTQTEQTYLNKIREAKEWQKKETNEIKENHIKLLPVIERVVKRKNKDPKQYEKELEKELNKRESIRNSLLEMTDIALKLKLTNLELEHGIKNFFVPEFQNVKFLYKRYTSDVYYAGAIEWESEKGSKLFFPVFTVYKDSKFTGTLITECIVLEDKAYKRIDDITRYTDKKEFSYLGANILIYSKLPEGTIDIPAEIPKEK